MTPRGMSPHNHPAPVQRLNRQSYRVAAGAGGGGGSVYIPPALPSASGPTSSSPTPTGLGFPQSSTSHLTLINQSGTFYLIINGQREGITDPGILNSYGLSFNQAQTPTAQELNLPMGSNLMPDNGALVKTAQDPTIYLISGGQRHGFTSASAFTSLGLKWSSVLVVTAPELDGLPLGNALSNGSAQHLPGSDIDKNGTIYWIGTDNQLHGYPSLAVYNSWHIANDFSKVVAANAADMSLPIGSLVSARVLQ